MADTKTGNGRGLTESEYASLPPENRAVLAWPAEYMSTPLTNEEKEYWQELREIVSR